MSVPAEVQESALVDVIYDGARLDLLHLLVFRRGGRWKGGGHAHRHGGQDYVDNLRNIYG